MTELTDLGAAELWLDRGSRRYAPSEVLTGQYDLSGWQTSDLKAVELTILWHTAGQGEEDFCVHHFERHDLLEENQGADPDSAWSFQTKLPQSPLSYDGQIVKVCWAARLRGFFGSRQQRIVEAPFWLGGTTP